MECLMRSLTYERLAGNLFWVDVHDNLSRFLQDRFGPLSEKELARD